VRRRRRLGIIFQNHSRQHQKLTHHSLRP
jgi:hypothetical protein